MIEPTTQKVAALILKNSLKNHFITLKDHSNEELNQIKKALYLALLQEGDLLQGSKALQEEFYLIVSAVIVKEFNSNPDEVALLQEILKLY